MEINPKLRKVAMLLSKPVLVWEEPEDTSVKKVFIYRATAKHGDYTTLASTNSTSDGSDKASTNSWVTNYTDSTGARTNWYKIRLYDGSTVAFSNYSEPVTSFAFTQLCMIEDVKKIIDSVGVFSDEEIFDAIQEVEDLMYAEMGTPIRSIYSDVGFNSVTSTTYRSYYVGEENIYRVDRIFFGTVTKTELFEDDGFKVLPKSGIVKILPEASSGPNLDRSQSIEIRFVPKIINRVALYRVVKTLLEKIDINSDGKISKELEIITTKLENTERILNQQIGFGLSSDYKSYDKVYGINRKKLVQDFDRNAYLGNYE